MVQLLAPTTLLYIALDGVAPTAKLQQQRARRFQAAKESADRHDLTAEAQGPPGPEAPASDPAARERADPNAISPGTGFMRRFGAALKGFVCTMCATDWAHLSVIVSDADVPGEGEHKVMHYVRQARALPDYNPRTRHIVYGADADLIMLALLTHEPNFQILREADPFGPASTKARYQLLSIGALRSHIGWEVDAARVGGPAGAEAGGAPGSAAGGGGPGGGGPLDLERIIDDFVFLCLFCGNDFLPALPGVVVADGDITALVARYFACLPTLGGYLTRDGDPDLDRLRRVIEGLVPAEEHCIVQKARRWKRWTAPARAPCPACGAGGRGAGRGAGGRVNRERAPGGDGDPTPARLDAAGDASAGAGTPPGPTGDGSSSSAGPPTRRMGQTLWAAGSSGTIARHINRCINAGHRDLLVCHNFNKIQWFVRGCVGVGLRGLRAALQRLNPPRGPSSPDPVP